MFDLLFPELTTYTESYQPHSLQGVRKAIGAAERDPFDYLSPEFQIKRPQTPRPDVPFEIERKEATQRVVPNYGAEETSCFGGVTINDLSPDEKEFFIKQTYRPTYLDYARFGFPTKISSNFGRQDEIMLKILAIKKPDLFDYGFNLPNEVCSAWGKAQARTIPPERERRSSLRRMENPFPGYPEKMYPLIENGQLNPHYDGSFQLSYTGFQPLYLGYPSDVNEIKRNDYY